MKKIIAAAFAVSFALASFGTLKYMNRPKYVGRCFVGDAGSAVKGAEGTVYMKVDSASDGKYHVMLRFEADGLGPEGRGYAEGYIAIPEFNAKFEKGLDNMRWLEVKCE